MSTLNKFHDATLEMLKFDWRKGTVYLLLRTGISDSDFAELSAHGVSDLRCPRLSPWGPSSSVNFSKLDELDDGSFLLSVEMQSGDVIEVRCSDVSITPPAQ